MIDTNEDMQAVLNQMLKKKNLKYLKTPGDNNEIYAKWMEYFTVW